MTALTPAPLPAPGHVPASCPPHAARPAPYAAPAVTALAGWEVLTLAYSVPMTTLPGDGPGEAY